MTRRGACLRGAANPEKAVLRYLLLLIATTVSLLVPGAGMTADPRFPDWPCAQIKVPEISVAAVWSGPSIDDVGTAWESDPAPRNLVARLAARRTPLDAAEAAISEFISGDAADRQEKGKLLFAGLFTILNQERSQVMNGLERFSRQQAAFANRIRVEISELRELQATPSGGSSMSWPTASTGIHAFSRSGARPSATPARCPCSSNNACLRWPERSSKRSSEAHSPECVAGLASSKGSPASCQPSVPSGYQMTPVYPHMIARFAAFHDIQQSRWQYITRDFARSPPAIRSKPIFR
jgi:hypothetical protein